MRTISRQIRIKNKVAAFEDDAYTDVEERKRRHRERISARKMMREDEEDHMVLKKNTDVHDDSDDNDKHKEFERSPEDMENHRKLGRMEFEDAKWEFDLAASSKHEVLYRRFYLPAFLFAIYVSNLSNLISTLVPIITQPEDTMSGDTLTFGKVLVREDALTALGFRLAIIVFRELILQQMLFWLTLVLSTGQHCHRVRHTNRHLKLPNLLMKSTLTRWGGRTSVDASGGLSGSSSMVQHTCAPYTSTTKMEMRRWITLEESAC